MQNGAGRPDAAHARGVCASLCDWLPGAVVTSGAGPSQAGWRPWKGLCWHARSRVLRLDCPNRPTGVLLWACGHQNASENRNVPRGLDRSRDRTLTARTVPGALASAQRANTSDGAECPVSRRSSRHRRIRAQDPVKSGCCAHFAKVEYRCPAKPAARPLRRPVPS